MRAFVFLVLAAAAAASWKIPVYDKTPFQAVEEYGDRDALDVPLSDGTKTDLRARSCADLDRAPKPYALLAGTDEEKQAAETVKNGCAELRLLLSAKAPKKAAGTTFSGSPLDEFPPCFAPVLKPVQAVDVVGKTWRSSSKTLEVNAESDHTLFVRDPGNAWSSVVRLIGRADFNGDGIDDILLRNAWKLADGATSGVSHVVLSRKAGAVQHRVVFDSSGRCTASMPAPAVCSPETIVTMRREFQKRYDAKEYASAYEFLDTFHEACRNRVSNVPRDYWGMRWIANDLAITAHHLGRDARCLELTRGAAFQDAPKGAEKFVAALDANRKLCEASLRCDAKKIAEARDAFGKEMAKNDLQAATAGLVAFTDGCEGSADPSAIALAYTDIASAANQAGDAAACSTWLDRAERLGLRGDAEDDAKSGAAKEISATRTSCPRPEPAPISTPMTAAPWAGAPANP